MDITVLHKALGSKNWGTRPCAKWRNITLNRIGGESIKFHKFISHHKLFPEIGNKPADIFYS